MTQQALVKIEGLLLEHKGSKSGTGKKGPWTLHKFSVQQSDGDVIDCQIFDNNEGTAFNTGWVNSNISFEAVHNAKYGTYLVQTEITVTEEEGGPVVIDKTETPAAATTTSAAPKKRGRPPKAKAAATPAKATVGGGASQVGKFTSTGTDWPAKDRSMNAGGLMHDAAAIVAATFPENATTASLLKYTEEIALGLVDVKLKVEAKIKG